MQVSIKRKRSSFFAIICFIALSVCFVGCNQQDQLSHKSSQICGTGQPFSELDGLFWLLGSPTTGNVLCTSSAGEFKVVQVLDPVSRDPILMQDQQSGQILLVERFSGPAARPSRASFFAPNGTLLFERGDWPQNTYSVLRTSAINGIITGFDFAELRDFSWSSSEISMFGSLGDFFKTLQKTNPVFTLKNGDWMALVDGGYDLQTFKALDSRAYLFDSKSPAARPSQIVLNDFLSGKTCKNLFQFMVLTNSSAVISCNPQYFGAVENEILNVFHLELTTEGELKVRNILSKQSSEVQRIDLWGQDSIRSRVFVGLKSTSVDDFQGKLMAAGWLNLSSGQWTPESRFAGPTYALPGGQLLSSCHHETSSCRIGDFALSRPDSADIKIIRPEFSLPFLSFPSSVPAP